MKLKAYIAAGHDTPTGLAAKCKVSLSTITRLRDGQRSPSIALAEKIAGATEGKVQPADFFREAAPAEAA